MRDIDARATRIRAIVSDVDGVLTDGRIYLDDQGVEMKAFNIHDGWAMVEARKQGLITGIITGRYGKVVGHRMRDLDVDFVAQGQSDKLKALGELRTKYALENHEIAYIGDDLIDLPVLLCCGLSMAPSNAREEVKSRVMHVTDEAGGEGAVRAMIELILKAQDKWEGVVARYTQLACLDTSKSD